ncbi:MAG: hypothetical protein EA381_01740 [Planctomycetaceae bacterium]|nr:MAG: hypothetical protein EA381_01740 [Planctomycetaceae bacterium]
MVTADLPEPQGQTVVAVAPDGEPVRIRVRVCWYGESHKGTAAIPIVAVDLLEHFDGKDLIGKLNDSVSRDAARAITHYLFIHRIGDEVLLAVLVPASELVLLWIKQQDKVREIGRTAELREFQKEFRKDGPVPTLWLQIGPESSAVIDEFWYYPGVIDLLRWDLADAAIQLPEEVRVAPAKLFDGALRRITINAFEANAAAKADCIRHHGTNCQICGMDFGRVYGPEAAGLIHVHHLKPISAISREYQIDPVRDLLPVCHNCHAVLHLGGKHRTVDEVKRMLNGGGVATL